MENVQFNFYADFGLTNFAVSNLAIINLANQGSMDSSDTVPQANIPCDQHTWKLILRNAQSSPGFEIKKIPKVVFLDFENLFKDCKMRLTTVKIPSWRYQLLLKLVSQEYTIYQAKFVNRAF